MLNTCDYCRCHTVLSSLCPGWVCYAEKTHGDWLLPYISR